MESLVASVTPVQSTDQQTTRSPQARRGAAQSSTHSAAVRAIHSAFGRKLSSTHTTSSYSDMDRSAHSQRPTADRLREVNRHSSRRLICRQFYVLIVEIVWAHFTSSYFHFFDTVQRRDPSRTSWPTPTRSTTKTSRINRQASPALQTLGFPPSPTKVHLLCQLSIQQNLRISEPQRIPLTTCTATGSMTSRCPRPSRHRGFA